MKRIVSMVLAFVMLLSLIPTVAFAASTMELTVDTSSVGTVNPGDEITVPVKVTSNPGFVAINLTVNLDADLEFVSMKKSTLAGTHTLAKATDAEFKYLWEAEDTEVNVTDTNIELFTLTLKVKETASAGDKEISLTVNKISNESLNSTTSTVVPGKVYVKYETAGLSFVNGSQTMTYDEAKANAESGEALTGPEGSYFVGWFTGLDENLKDANGYYVIEPTETAIFAGTELRPRYDLPPTEGTYNALWIKGEGSYAVTVGEPNTVYVGTSDSDALSLAITGANGTDRTKLVQDVTIGTTSDRISVSTALNLDLNGHKFIASQTRALTMTAASTGHTIESSRKGGEFTGKYEYLYNGAQFDLIRDVDFIGTKNYAAVHLASATKIENCNFEGYIQFKSTAGNTLINNCTIATSSFIITGVQKNAVVTITNTNMSSTGTNPLFVGSAEANATYGDGSVVLGAGNSVTAEKASAMFRYLNPAKFADFTSTYQIKPGGTLINVLNGVDAKVECSDASMTATVGADGKILFGEPCTVTYMVDGNLVTTRDAVKGYGADLTVTYEYGNKTEFKLLGWTTDSAATTPMSEIIVNGDTTLHAVKGRKGVMIGTGTAEYESGSHEYSTKDTVYYIYNADRLNELDGLTLKYNDSSYTRYVVFSAEALDHIASQVTGEAKDITIKFDKITADTTVGTKGGIEFAITYGNEAITLNGGVEARVKHGTSSVDNYKFAAYEVNDPEKQLEVEMKKISSNYYYCFQIFGNGSYNVIQLPGTFLPEDQMTGNVSVTVKNGDTDVIIENADKIEELNSLTVSNGSDISFKFSADALDSIGENVTTEGMTVRVVSVEPTSEGTVARAELSVLDGNGDAVDFEGAVEIVISFTYEDDKNYRAYFIPDDGSDPVGYRTNFEVTNETSRRMKATFTTNHFSAYEIRETSVADGYTAEMDITESEVRAGGKSVNVPITVSHSDLTKYNAGEVKVQYKDELLSFNRDASTLPANATYTDADGLLTIEFYGDEIDLTHTINLVFTTCESVDAEVTTQIELTGAAFIDSAEAKKEDLQRATLAVAEDSVLIKLETFEVTLPDDSRDNVEGSTEAVKGDPYVFTIVKDEQYTYNVTATVERNGEKIQVNVTENPSGTYTIEGMEVNGPIEVTYEKIANEYNVKFEGESPAVNDGDKAKHDTAYNFTLPTKAQWQYSYEIVIGEDKFENASVDGNVITIPGEYITGDIVVTISCVQTEFNITMDANDATWEEVGNGDGSVDRGEAVKVTITPAEGYTYTVTAVKTGTEEEVKVTNNNDNTYTISNIQNDLTIIVTKSLAGTVTVTHYLTLDADNTENPSLSMFLVRYEGELAEGYVPYCGEQAMYWSSAYNAFCTLQIGTTQTAVEESISVSVASANKTNIDYTMNVNGSEDTDAADAQLVYDMKMAMYQNFDDVDMMKFLLADTNKDKVITIDDAQAIIDSILGITQTA